MTENSSQVARMAGMSGEGSGKAPKFLTPLIRFDGNRGEFRMISLDENKQKVETPLKKPIKLVILRKRRLLSSFSPTVSHFTTEHNSINDKIQVFSNTAGQIKHEMTGYTKEIRAQFPLIKTHEVIYALYNDEVIRFEIKGGSLSGYYDYQKELQSEGIHCFQVTTVLSSEKAKNEASFAYNRVTFEKADLEVSLDDVEEKMNFVNENLKKVDDFFTAKMLKNAPAAVSDDAGGAPKDDINPDDIPF